MCSLNEAQKLYGPDFYLRRSTDILSPDVRHRVRLIVSGFVSYDFCDAYFGSFKFRKLKKILSHYSRLALLIDQ